MVGGDSPSLANSVGNRVVAAERAQFEITVGRVEGREPEPGILGIGARELLKDRVDMGRAVGGTLRSRLAEHEIVVANEVLRGRPVAGRVERDVEIADSHEPAGEVGVGKRKGIAKGEPVVGGVARVFWV